MRSNSFLNVAQVVPATEAEGPGRRYALWLQGCPLRCPGCCNPEMLPYAGGVVRSVGELCTEIVDARDQLAIEGITFLGGEPFAQADGAARLAQAVRGLGLSVMVFTGFDLEELRRSVDPGVHALLANTDLLVDGPYVRELPEKHRRWIGSANQRVHFLTDRHDPDDPCWRLANTLEIRLENGEVTINGFPAVQARPLWKR